MAGDDRTDATCTDATYTDAKGRRRWRCNDTIADQLQQLHDLLVIGGKMKETIRAHAADRR
ncbi:MAG: hypothetical protein CMJ18_18720 [Phycisphaeraceae bacterium]|nr:hypothetical protein [Phycisphaeraceae bacterium]